MQSKHHNNHSTKHIHPQNPHSSGPSSDNEHNPISLKPRTKMLAFIDSLYAKFKLLNRLSEQESSHFQTEIITMLIDEDECVDAQLYQQTVQKIGLGTFVLEVLGGIVQKKNKFHNQYEMNRNLEEIAKELEKQRLQLLNKNKLSQKKQLAIKKKQSDLIKLIQDKALEIQQNLKNHLLNIEEQTKKRTKTLLNNLKSKEKQLTDKVAAFKQSLVKLKDLQSKQKCIQEKLKLLDKKEKQRKARQTAEKQQQLVLQESNKKISQTKNKLATLEQTNHKLEQEISKLCKKLKTNEMAYKHLKDQTDKKLFKFNQLNHQLAAITQSKESFIQQLEKHKHHNQKLHKQLSFRQNQILKLNQRLKALQSTINQQKTQAKPISVSKNTRQQHKFTPIISQHQPLVSQPQRLIFDELDISKIQDPIVQSNQNLPVIRSPFDSNQDLSILDHVAQSIMVMERRLPDDQLNELSRTVDIQKQISNWEKLSSSCLGQEQEEDDHEEQEEQDEDSQKQRHYVMNMKRTAIITKHNEHQAQQKGSAQNNIYNNINGPKRSSNQKQQLKGQVFRQNITRLRQQQEQFDDEPSEIHQIHQLSQIGSLMYLDQPMANKTQNIALFDNYFATTDKSHKSQSKPSAGQGKELSSTCKPTQKSPHDLVLLQITSLMTSPSQQQQSACESLKSLTRETLLTTIKRIASPEMKHPRTLVEPFLELLLVILEPCSCPCHQKSLRYLFSQQLIVFLQQILLKFEAVVKDIQEKSIIILSRILLSYQSDKQLLEANNQSQTFILKDKYLKSLKVKLLLEKDQFIRSNIKFLMEYE